MMMEASFASQRAAVPPWAIVIRSSREEPDVLTRISVAANSTWTILVGRRWRLALADRKTQWQSRGEIEDLIIRDHLAVQRRAVRGVDSIDYRVGATVGGAKARSARRSEVQTMARLAFRNLVKTPIAVGSAEPVLILIAAAGASSDADGR